MADGDRNSKSTTVNEEMVVQAYASLARFCDDQYQHIDNYMNSKDFEEKNSLMRQIKEEGHAM